MQSRFPDSCIVKHCIDFAGRLPIDMVKCNVCVPFTSFRLRHLAFKEKKSKHGHLLQKQDVNSGGLQIYEAELRAIMDLSRINQRENCDD